MVLLEEPTVTGPVELLPPTDVVGNTLDVEMVEFDEGIAIEDEVVIVEEDPPGVPIMLERIPPSPVEVEVSFELDEVDVGDGVVPIRGGRVREGMIPPRRPPGVVDDEDDEDGVALDLVLEAVVVVVAPVPKRGRLGRIPPRRPPGVLLVLEDFATDDDFVVEVEVVVVAVAVPGPSKPPGPTRPLRNPPKPNGSSFAVDVVDEGAAVVLAVLDTTPPGPKVMPLPVEEE